MIALRLSSHFSSEYLRNSLAATYTPNSVRPEYAAIPADLGIARPRYGTELSPAHTNTSKSTVHMVEKSFLVSTSGDSSIINAYACKNQNRCIYVIQYSFRLGSSSSPSIAGIVTVITQHNNPSV